MDNQSGVHAQSTACLVMTVGGVSDRTFSFLARHCGRTTFGSYRYAFKPKRVSNSVRRAALVSASSCRECAASYYCRTGTKPPSTRALHFEAQHDFDGGIRRMSTRNTPIGHRSRSVPTPIYLLYLMLALASVTVPWEHEVRLAPTLISPCLLPCLPTSERAVHR